MKPKRTNIGRTIAVLAAVVCLLLACGATAVATNLFGLRDLIIAPEAEVGFDGNKETVELISLQGYADSPEAQAAGEWQEFYAAYVPTLNLDNSIFAPGTAYNNYSVYDQTMADKLEEIAEKYHLTLYENMADLFDESALNEAMGGPFLSGACTFLATAMPRLTEPLSAAYACPASPSTLAASASVAASATSTAQSSRAEWCSHLGPAGPRSKSPIQITPS